MLTGFLSPCLPLTQKLTASSQASNHPSPLFHCTLSLAVFLSPVYPHLIIVSSCAENYACPCSHSTTRPPVLTALNGLMAMATTYSLADTVRNTYLTPFAMSYIPSYPTPQPYPLAPPPKRILNLNPPI